MNSVRPWYGFLMIPMIGFWASRPGAGRDELTLTILRREDKFNDIGAA